MMAYKYKGRLREHLEAYLDAWDDIDAYLSGDCASYSPESVTKKQVSLRLAVTAASRSGLPASLKEAVRRIREVEHSRAKIHICKILQDLREFDS